MRHIAGNHRQAVVTCGQSRSLSSAQLVGGRAADGHADGLVGVGADLEGLLGERTVEEFDAVESSCRRHGRFRPPAEATSVWMVARSDSELVELADWTARVRRRCRLSEMSDNAPSAVCDSEIASLALRAAWSGR